MHVSVNGFADRIGRWMSTSFETMDPFPRPSFGLEAATSTPIKRRGEREDASPLQGRGSVAYDRLIAKPSGQTS
jgi:hypothetical protein